MDSDSYELISAIATDARRIADSLERIATSLHVLEKEINSDDGRHYGLRDWLDKAVRGFTDSRKS